MLTANGSKLVSPSNYSHPASGEICIFALINPTLGTATSQAIITDQPDLGTPREQKFHFRLDTNDELSFTWVDNATTIHHIYSDVSTFLSAGLQLVGVRGNYAAATWELYYNGAWHAASDDQAPGATINANANPIIIANNGDGTTPFSGSIHWIGLWDSDSALSAGDIQGMNADTDNIHRCPLRYAQSNLIHYFDLLDATYGPVNQITQEAFTVTLGSGSWGAVPDGVEMGRVGYWSNNGTPDISCRWRSSTPTTVMLDGSWNASYNPTGPVTIRGGIQFSGTPTSKGLDSAGTCVRCFTESPANASVLTPWGTTPMSFSFKHLTQSFVETEACWNYHSGTTAWPGGAGGLGDTAGSADTVSATEAGVGTTDQRWNVPIPNCGASILALNSVPRLIFYRTTEATHQGGIAITDATADSGYLAEFELWAVDEATELPAAPAAAEGGMMMMGMGN